MGGSMFRKLSLPPPPQFSPGKLTKLVDPGALSEEELVLPRSIEELLGDIEGGNMEQITSLEWVYCFSKQKQWEEEEDPDGINAIFESIWVAARNDSWLHHKLLRHFAFADGGNVELLEDYVDQLEDRQQQQEIVDYLRSKWSQLPCAIQTAWDKRIEFQCLQTFGDDPGIVLSVAISPDGETIVSGSEDNSLKIWNLETGELVRTIEGHSDWVWSVAISPDGETIVSGSYDKSLKIWNLKTGELVRTLEGHSDWIWSVAISPDGETIVSGSADDSLKNLEPKNRRVSAHS